MAQILILDDDKDIRLLLEKFLSKKGFSVFTAPTGSDAIELLRKEAIDLVLCDFKLPDFSGVEMLQKIKILKPQAQVIIITGYSDVRIAVDALKKGAYEYVTKPLYPDEILHTIEEALAAKSSEPREEAKASPTSTSSAPDQKPAAPAQKPQPQDFVKGNSPQAQAVQRHIDLIAPTNMSVVILGETGTGKEYVARTIHRHSERAEKPFVAVDCGALPKEIAGSELFGHVKGSFTGAIQDKAGCFEQANGGTLFLDEVGNLTYDNQIKLLRVLQERKVKRLGGNEEHPVDVRVLAATNDNLLDEVQKGNFREDLYYRLNEFKIDLAPIRQRPDDIETFARHFLKLANLQLKKEVTHISEGILNTLRTYPWPGNLREMRNVIKRAVLLSTGSSLQPEALPQEILKVPQKDSDQGITVEGVLGMSLKKVAEIAEKQAILEVLEKTQHNKSRTAELLSIDRKTLYNKMKAYGILDKQAQV